MMIQCRIFKYCYLIFKKHENMRKSIFWVPLHCEVEVTYEKSFDKLERQVRVSRNVGF